MQVNPISRSIKAVDANGRPTQDLNLFTEACASLAEITLPAIGTGNPEGVLEAKQGKLYFDTAGSPGSRLYFKQVDDISGDKSLGWGLA